MSDPSAEPETSGRPSGWNVSVAVPVLEDALSNKDVEIVYRAERPLFRLGRAVP